MPRNKIHMSICRINKPLPVKAQDGVHARMSGIRGFLPQGP